MDRHHRDAAGRNRLLVVLKLLKSAPIEEMQELAEEMFEVVLKPLRVEDVDGVDELELREKLGEEREVERVARGLWRSVVVHCEVVREHRELQRPVEKRQERVVRRP